MRWQDVTKENLCSPPNNTGKNSGGTAIDLELSGVAGGTILDATISDQLYATLESAAGGGGVKGMRAKAELAQARARNWTEDWNARQLQGAAASRRAGRAVQRADKETLAREALEAEEARLAQEQAAREAEAAEKRNAGRQALRARAALWEGEG